MKHFKLTTDQWTYIVFFSAISGLQCGLFGFGVSMVFWYGCAVVGTYLTTDHKE